MSQSKLPRGLAYLCERCSQMTMTLPGLRALASKEGYQHLLIEELWRSADRGCPMCIGLRNSHKYHTFSQYTEPYIRIFSRVHLLMKYDFENDILPESVGHPFETARLVELRSAVWDDSLNWETERFRLPNVSSLSTFTGKGDPAENYLRVKDISIPIVRNLTIQNVKALLADCYTGHNHCPKAGSTTLPSRVIDVGRGDKPLVLLHVTQPHEKAEYLALSYPWGGPQEIKTTTATLSRWRLGIPIDTLPPTLQDAIAVTRDLGFRYLWVDALCIIQDDTEDKVAEINRMGTIYKNSTLTIAAANTTSVRESFLSPRPIPATWSVPYLLPNGKFGNLWISAGQLKVISSPLDTRAWALQESLLSPRVLWYGPTALKWKCQATEFRDVHEATVNCWNYSGIKHHRLPSGVFGNAEPTGPDLRNQQSIIWKKVVEDYSGRDITFPDDRLPALAGIASELQRLWRDDYVAGMWRSCLIKHLGWYRTGEEDVSPPAEGNLSNLHLPLTYQSPGWSWISFEGEVSIMEVFYEHAQVIECDVNLVDNTAPMSRVRDGRLVLKAACIDEEQRLKTNYEDCWFKWDYNQCAEQENVSRDFQYSLLGYKEQERRQNDFGERKGIALVLAPAGDGTFMRIGTVFGFSTKDWPIEALERQIITII
ncbi:heterokaryon incompatibility protein-domain-containing protein [Leptodontidium sp. MPI-SDFR-AT-0119]|nr:heterokaryon incompatibility protein-domain-containing protein [Leptodontidium sp. MPI-SDFR-AT-0119]